jgi:hypothetical protein
VFLLTAGVLTATVFLGEGIDAYYRSRLPDMVHGTAWRPYVTRALVPAAARVGEAALPASARSALSEVFSTWRGRPDGWQSQHAADYVFVVAIMAASLVGFAFALRDLFGVVFGARAGAASATALAALAAVPLFLGPFSRQIYDFTTLWLFTAALAAMARGRWGTFLVLFALATINKETSILLTLVFAIHSIRAYPRSSVVSLLVAQLLMFLVIRGTLAYVFRDNPGGAVELHLFDHNQYVLLHPLEMSKRPLVLAGAGVVGAWRWRRKPPLLRDALVTLAPVLLLVGVTVGQLDEIRAYYEIYPVVVLLVAESACHALGIYLGSAQVGAAQVGRVGLAGRVGKAGGAGRA